MTPEQLQQAAKALLSLLRKHGSGTEKNLSVLGSSAYKPFYRACALMYSSEIQGIMGGKPPTLEEALEICKAAHPWFVHALEQEPEWFEDIYQFHVEAQ